MGAKTKLLSFLAISFFLSTSLFADSERIFTGLTEEPIVEFEPLPEIVTPARPELKLETDAQRVRVDKFLISGNRNVSTDELLASIEKYKGRELTIPQLLELADVLTRVYWEKGYVTSFAYIPVQKMERGILEIEVAEGRPGRIIVENNKYYTSRFIAKHLDNVTEEPILNNKTMERGLLLLNEYPKLNVKATLTKGEEAGTTDIVLDVYEPWYPMNFALFYNNFGSRYTGVNRVGINWEWANLTKHGDVLSLTALVNPEDFDQLFYWKAGYTIAAGSYGTKFNFDYSRMNYEVKGDDDIKYLQIDGEAEIFGVGVTHPLIRARDRNLSWNAAIKKKYYTNYLLDRLYQSSEDDYAVMELGLKGDRVFRGNNHSYFTLKTTMGLGEMFGGMSDSDYTESSRPSLASGTWLKLNLDLTNIKQLGKIQLVTRGAGQYSTNSLVTGEQFVIGGPDSVRGYPTGEFLGDRGYLLSAEVRTPLFPVETFLNKYANLAFFADHGRTYYKDILPSGGDEEGDLTSVGLGLRVYIPCHFYLRFDAGYPIGPEASDGDSWRYWLNAALEF